MLLLWSVPECGYGIRHMSEPALERDNVMRMNGRRLLSVGLTWALWCFAVPALAQPAVTPTPTGEEQEPQSYAPCDTEPDESSMQGAQGAFQAGSASFNEADYPRAIFYWEDAYRRDCTAHAMLKNLARAYELNEQFRHAIMALKTYLERNPESGEGEAIQRRIEALERKYEERKAALAAAAAAEEEERRRKERERTKTIPPENSTPDSLTPEDDAFTAGPERSVVPLVIAGIGGGVGVLGGVQWLVALQDAKDAEDDCGPEGRAQCVTPDGTRNQAAIDAGNEAVDRQLLWGIVGGAGAAVAVGGVIWYFAQPDPEPDPFAGISPRLGPGYAGLDFSQRF